MARAAYAGTPDNPHDDVVSSIYCPSDEGAISIARNWAAMGMHAWARNEADEVIYDSEATPNPTDDIR